ncbi:hypothetical protein RND71_026973 [Anisodus tanguticus]|uniref:Uncharacterized protein n=1 Tax=Anisodus tanguticus TaxID=243964 RepID=A0AAE1RLV0_9SOLA|nr:hypothetical protein RND71_026973 [Anisodus tanguticus]
MNSHGGRNGESNMMEEDLSLNGLTSGQKVNWEQNGEINGRRNFLVALVHGKGRLGMHHLAAKGGQGCEEEHFGNGKVHKYGKSTTGESWDMVVDEKTYYEAEPHYGWADVVDDSSQLFSIQPREQPPGVYPNIDFGSFMPPDNEYPPTR